MIRDLPHIGTINLPDAEQRLDWMLGTVQATRGPFMIYHERQAFGRQTCQDEKGLGPTINPGLSEKLVENLPKILVL